MIFHSQICKKKKKKNAPHMTYSVAFEKGTHPIEK